VEIVSLTKNRVAAPTKENGFSGNGESRFGDGKDHFSGIPGSVFSWIVFLVKISQKSMKNYIF